MGDHKGIKPGERETLLPRGGHREGVGEKAASELGLRGETRPWGWKTGDTHLQSSKSEQEISQVSTVSLGKVCDTEPQQVPRGWGRVAWAGWSSNWSCGAQRRAMHV